MGEVPRLATIPVMVLTSCCDPSSYWNRGVSDKANRTTSSPVTVLMSWCMAKHLNARDLVNDRFQHLVRQFQQVVPHLLDEIPALLR